MFKFLARTFAVSVLAIAAAQAQPQPQQIDAVYELYRNGQKLGTVTDRFSRSGQTYRIVSETRAEGLLKYLWPGTIRLQSQGQIDRAGLRPLSFEHARSDRPEKTAYATLNWDRHSITYRYKGETREVKGLRDATQDQLSQLYQFVFMPKLPGDFSLDVVSGKKTNDYRYRRRDGGTLHVPAGAFAVQAFERVTGPSDDKAVTVWVAPGRNNVPVQVRVVEDDTTLEQRLVKLTIQP